MRSEKIIILLLSLLMIIGCESNDEEFCDPLVLDLSIDEESISWLPSSYFDSENILFINEQDETKEFFGQGTSFFFF
jgi:uncharacterized protein YcfL